MLGAALGYVILLIVLEAGKIAFGRKRIRFDASTPFTWTKREDDADFVVGSEQSLWSDHFAREKDRLLLDCDEVKIDNHSYAGVTLDFHYDRVAVEGNVLALDYVTRISGVARRLLIPREAMGRGDLKFLAAIGAFLGWRAVLFSLFAGSLLGSIIGLITLVAGKRVWSAKLVTGVQARFDGDDIELAGGAVNLLHDGRRQRNAYAAGQVGRVLCVAGMFGQAFDNGAYVVIPAPIMASAMAAIRRMQAATFAILDGPPTRYDSKALRWQDRETKKGRRGLADSWPCQCQTTFAASIPD